MKLKKLKASSLILPVMLFMVPLLLPGQDPHEDHDHEFKRFRVALNLGKAPLLLLHENT